MHGLDLYERDNEAEKSSADEDKRPGGEAAQEPQQFLVVWRSFASLELHFEATYTRPEAEHIARNLLINHRPSRIYKVNLP
jgi:hypothetical protein|tara:strand:+ start:10367 stop:10609 length:243 start_codon:yes stop_codon:yes gene_type:complete